MELHGRDALLQIEHPAVLPCLAGKAEIHRQVAEGHVVPCIGRYALHLAEGDLLCLLDALL